MLALASLSCGRGGAQSSSAQPPAGVDGSGSAAREILGSAPDFAFSLRFDRLRDDPVYAPLLREAGSEKEMQKILENAAIIDAVGAFDGASFRQVSLVGVLRAAPPMKELPASFRKAIEQSPDAHPLPSGVVEYASIDKQGWPYGFYVTSHDWVLLAGRGAGPGHDWFSTHTAAPPPVDFGDAVLAGFWLGGEAMKRPAMAEAMKEPGSRGLESMTLVLRDGAHGDLLYSGTYATTADAENAARVATEQLGMYASVWKNTRDKCPGLSALTLETERSGRTVSIRIAHIPEAVRAAMHCKW